MYLLDTNVVSELRRPHPHPAVVGWIEHVAADELLLSAVTVGGDPSGHRTHARAGSRQGGGTGGVAQRGAGFL